MIMGKLRYLFLEVLMYNIYGYVGLVCPVLKLRVSLGVRPSIKLPSIHPKGATLTFQIVEVRWLPYSSKRYLFNLAEVAFLPIEVQDPRERLITGAKASVKCAGAPKRVVSVLCSRSFLQKKDHTPFHFNSHYF